MFFFLITTSYLSNFFFFGGAKSRSKFLIYVVFLSFRVCLSATGKNRKYTDACVPASVYEQLTADQGFRLHHV